MSKTITFAIIDNASREFINMETMEELDLSPLNVENLLASFRANYPNHTVCNWHVNGSQFQGSVSIDTINVYTNTFDSPLWIFFLDETAPIRNGIHSKNDYYKIERGVIIHLALNLKGGWGGRSVGEDLSSIRFVDLNSENGPVQIKPGKHTGCYTAQEFTVFDLVLDGYTNLCPSCSKFVQPKNCGFYKCEYRFWGLIIRSPPKPAEKLRSPWKSTLSDLYTAFNEENHGIANYARLVIETRPSPIKISLAILPNAQFACKKCRFRSRLRVVEERFINDVLRNGLGSLVLVPCVERQHERDLCSEKTNEEEGILEFFVEILNTFDMSSIVILPHPSVSLPSEIEANWSFHSPSPKTPFSLWKPATTLNIHSDLLHYNLIPPPLKNESADIIKLVSELNWTYRISLSPFITKIRELVKKLEKNEVWKVELELEGLDTLCEVFWGGEKLIETKNISRRWIVDVTSLILHDANGDGSLAVEDSLLELQFSSSVNYIAMKQSQRRMRGMNMGISGDPHIRKTPCHFGWDWGPAIPSIGINKPVKLHLVHSAKIVSIQQMQKFLNLNTVELTVKVQVERVVGFDGPLSIEVIVKPPTGSNDLTVKGHITESETTVKLVLPDVQRWWPHTHGSQPVYKLGAKLTTQSGTVVDTKTLNVGFRTLSLETSKDKFGESFYFTVNDLKVWCRGMNWIPMELFPNQITSERLRHLLNVMKITGNNMVRVWGGGTYESDEFYDICDELGILVWQDFLFACATYPFDDPEYNSNCVSEIRENVTRIRHHSSLAVYSGNNEIEALASQFYWFSSLSASGKELEHCYREFFYETLPCVINECDEMTPYWPSSPGTGKFGEFLSNAGDQHLWQVYHALYAPKDYTRRKPRFVSEFGFQSLPNFNTLQEFTNMHHKTGDDTEEITVYEFITSTSLKAHQKSFAGNVKIPWYLAKNFLIPKTMLGYIYFSQIYAGECIATGIKYWRRDRECTMGALVWQFNDIWPSISWSVIDYYGRWKGSMYILKRAFASETLFLEVENEGYKKRVSGWYVCDIAKMQNVKVEWSVETLNGEVLRNGTVSCEIKEESVCVFDVEVQEHRKWNEMVFVCAVYKDGVFDGYKTATFCEDKFIHYVDPKIQIEADYHRDSHTVNISVTPIESFARYVFIDLANNNGTFPDYIHFTDNYFDVPKNRTVTVSCNLPKGESYDEDTFKKHLKVVDIYQMSRNTYSRFYGDNVLSPMLFSRMGAEMGANWFYLL
ncbi:Mannan endo-1,4-beta-mannosidase [Nowakowskiella sp. JEL0407]|nr:Mannan endo-1,4-beta-mannosidase [Nowakowskiella sp. JEL0407]